MPRRYLIMAAVSLGFFFVTATTFTSLGYVLYTMVAELGWSKAAAGLSFSLLGLACGLSSPLAPMMMKWMGTRLTMFIGGLVLSAGFLLAGLVHGIGLFFVATTLMGIGFSLIAPSPAVFLLATWFPKTAPRMIGFYFMAGAFGGVVGPLIVGTIVTLSGSWRLHWFVMAASSVLVGLVCLLAVRDAVAVRSTEQVKQAAIAEAGPDIEAPVLWTVREAMMSPSFLILALAMIVIQTVVTTMHSVLVTHVADLGAGSAPGAIAMSLLALTGTLTKGVTGALTERLNPRLLLVIGLSLQCVAMVLLAATATPVWAYVFALLFGMGWGLSWLSAHILLIRYFGSHIAGDMVAMATMATTFAVVGPISAGWVADTTGGFGPIFVVFAALLAMVIVSSVVFLRAPKPRAAKPVSATDPTAPVDLGLTAAE